LNLNGLASHWATYDLMAVNFGGFGLYLDGMFRALTVFKKMLAK
jgi:hypothetical protein